MKIAIIGAGYVGLVTGACLAKMGNRVFCVDIDEKKIDRLLEGYIPFYEPGLEELVKETYSQGTLSFTTDLKIAVTESEVVFITVGTPMKEDRRPDLRYVESVAKMIGNVMEKPLLVVNKSTVPVGTADMVRETIANVLNERNKSISFDVIANPEFLKEGDAINDFMRPDRIIVGAESQASFALIRELYAPFVHNHDRIIEMDIKSAEMTKYAANAMLAAKISFMNEIATICEQVSADVNQVRIGIGSDPRIGYHFIYPGCGYGGSCFPKDVNALIHTALDCGLRPSLLQAVASVNESQKFTLVNKALTHFNRKVVSRRFAVWGLSFKPETDDMREAPSLTIIQELIANGATVSVYDPKAIAEAQQVYFKDLSITYAATKYDALDNADALLLLTEWKEFRSPDFDEIKQRMKTPVIFDGRNQYNAELLKSKGFTYYQIGVQPL